MSDEGHHYTFGPPKGGWPDLSLHHRRPYALYIAGPMRGYPHCNFRAFDKGRDVLIRWGVTPVSPADHDRSLGFNETSCLQCTNEEVAAAGLNLKMSMGWDIEVIKSGDVDGLVLLPGWEKSTGVRGELKANREVGGDLWEFKYTPTGEGPYAMEVARA